MNSKILSHLAKRIVSLIFPLYYLKTKSIEIELNVSGSSFISWNLKCLYRIKLGSPRLILKMNS